MSAMFTLAQTQYRFYEDGTESGSVAIANQNTDITRAVSSPQLLLRVMIDETGGVAGGATDDYQLQASLNGGAFQNVTTSSTVVKAFASGNLTDAGATTNRLTGGTGTFSGTASVSEDGLVDNYAVPSNGFGELLYAIELVPADLANNDALAFRVLRNGATFTYSVTPGITASVAATHATSGALTGQIGSVAGSAAHVAIHTTTGALTGPGSTVAGSATRFRTHVASGVLAGLQASITGSAARAGSAIMHDTSGALQGQSGSVVGVAARMRAHATSGVLAGLQAAVTGSAARIGGPVSHATTGALVGGSGAITGSASRIGWVAIPPQATPSWTPIPPTEATWE